MKSGQHKKVKHHMERSAAFAEKAKMHAGKAHEMMGKMAEKKMPEKMMKKAKKMKQV